MDTPSDAFTDKMKLKEILKLEPTIMEKKFIKSNREIYDRIKREEAVEEKMKYRESVKDLYCMGIKTKLAKGPNPLSIKKKSKVPGIKDNNGSIYKRHRKKRLRNGKRSKKLD